MAQDIVIGGRLHSAATGNTVAGANEILDDAKGKKQNVINQEVDNEIGSDSAAGTIKGRIKNLETAHPHLHTKLFFVIKPHIYQIKEPCYLSSDTWLFF